MYQNAEAVAAVHGTLPIQATLLVRTPSIGVSKKLDLFLI